MPTIDYCVDQVCGRMLVRGFTYLSLFLLLMLYTFIIIMMVFSLMHALMFRRNGQVMQVL